jgi:metal-responsive CopG/Arc/MetJ family transcriptional regulator
MKDCRFTIRLTGEEMAMLSQLMKRHKIRKRTALLRVALKALEEKERKKEKGEITIRLPKNLLAFLKMKKSTGYIDYSHIICDLVRAHFDGKLEEVQAQATRFDKAHKSIVTVPFEEEELPEV